MYFRKQKTSQYYTIPVTNMNNKKKANNNSLNIYTHCKDLYFLIDLIICEDKLILSKCDFL